MERGGRERGRARGRAGGRIAGVVLLASPSAWDEVSVGHVLDGIYPFVDEASPISIEIRVRSQPED